MASAGEVIYLILEVIILAGIFVGNIMTIVAVAKEKKLQTKTNAIIVSLSVADLVVGVSYVLSHYLFKWIQVSVIIQCGTFNFFLALPLHVSAFHLAMIACERYVAVIFPLHYYIIVTKRKMAAAIITAWSVSFLIALTILLTSQLKTQDSSCRLNPYKDFVWFSAIMVFLSMAASILLYARIFLVAWQQSKKINATGFESTAKRMRDIKAAKVLSLTIGVFVICWVPYLIYLLLRISLAVSKDYYINYFLLLLAVSNSAFNFCVYAIMNRLFRQTFKKLCCAKCAK